MSRLIYSATITASADVANVEVKEINAADGFRASVVASAVGGTLPNFAIAVQTSPNDADWFTLGSFAAITANGSESIAVTGPIHQRIRLSIVVTGTAPTANLKVYIGG